MNRLGIFTVLVGCLACSTRPARIGVPSFDPQATADRALAEYDVDRDGRISEAELATAPGLASARASIDANADGHLDADEIAARLQSWIDRKQALIIVPCRVLRRGQPLADARIRFIPEPFLGDAFRPAEGTTNADGTTSIVHAPEDRPDPEFSQGIGIGIYRVEVSKQVDGKETIPARYNTESELGQEIAAGSVGNILSITLAD